MTRPEGGTLGPVGFEQLYWARHILRTERNLVINVEPFSAVGRMALLYSAVIESPKLVFKAYWLSFRNTLHSQNIDGWAEHEETGGRAPVEMLVYDSKSRNVFVRMLGWAQKVSDDRALGVRQALDSIRLPRGDTSMLNRPEVPYEATIHTFTIPVPVHTNGHTGEDHAWIDPERLSGFRGQPVNRYLM